MSGLLLGAFAGEGPLILGLNETLERRYGKKIAAGGIYRDPVRPTHETFAKSSGLGWVLGMRDAVGGGPLGFSGMGLALPCCLGSLRALCHRAGQTPQEDNRVNPAAAPASKAMVPTAGDDGAADRAYASFELLDRCRKPSDPVTFVARLRSAGDVRECRGLVDAG